MLIWVWGKGESAYVIFTFSALFLITYNVHRKSFLPSMLLLLSEVIVLFITYMNLNALYLKKCNSIKEKNISSLIFNCLDIWQHFASLLWWFHVFPYFYFFFSPHLLVCLAFFFFFLQLPILSLFCSLPGH